MATPRVISSNVCCALQGQLILGYFHLGIGFECWILKMGENAVIAIKPQDIKGYSVKN